MEAVFPIIRIDLLIVQCYESFVSLRGPRQPAHLSDDKRVFDPSQVVQPSQPTQNVVSVYPGSALDCRKRGAAERAACCLGLGGVKNLQRAVWHVGQAVPQGSKCNIMIYPFCLYGHLHHRSQ